MDAALTLGVDGGASGARAYVVERSAERSEEGSLRALTPGESLDWNGERAAALAGMLARLCADQPGREVRVGLCFPGAKTEDGRGIASARHGPALPHLLDDLERELERRGVRLAAPIPPLCSDGDAAAWGEHWAAGGALAGLRNGYVVGAGTGLAEGLLLAGRPLRMQLLRDRLAPPWELKSRSGEILDDCLSAAGMQRAGGAAWARDLGEFLAERLAQLWPSGAGRLERIVIAQRSGVLLADRSRGPEVRRALECSLQQALSRVYDGAVRDAYLPDGRLVPDLVVASTLRAAPAIGAAGLALGLSSSGLSSSGHAEDGPR